MKVWMAWACVALWLAGAAVALADGPRDCVRRAGEALDQADVSLFQQVVDVDGLVTQAVDELIRESRSPEVARQMPPMLALALSQAATGEGVGPQVRALFVREGRAFLLNGIASGAFAGKPVPNARVEGLLAPLFAQASMGRKELVQIGEAEKVEGGWMVPCTLIDDGNEQEYPVNALVSLQNGALRVTRIVNLPEIFAQIREEARQLEE